MLKFKSGDLVVLKSGGPVMTVDTVNTDIFDDHKMTGVFCAWFVGNQLTRVRFDHRAIELVAQPARAPADAAPIDAAATDVAPIQVNVVAEPEASGDYKDVLDTMMGAMNTAPDPLVVTKPPKPPRRPRAPPRQPVPEKTH